MKRKTVKEVLSEYKKFPKGLNSCSAKLEWLMNRLWAYEEHCRRVSSEAERLKLLSKTIISENKKLKREIKSLPYKVSKN